MKKTLVFIVVLAMVLVFVPTAAFAADITVSDSTELAAAIVSASSGDTIYVDDGTYELAPKTTIDKNLTIIGESEDGVKFIPSGDTGSVDDNRAWLLVNAGVTLNLSNVTMDGTGYKVHTAIRSNGTLNVENITICHIKYTKYIGIGIGVYAGNLAVANVTMLDIERLGIHAKTGTVINGFTYTGKGDVDGLDYAMEIGTVNASTPAFSVDISNVTITDCRGVATSDGSGSAGIYINTYFYSAGGGLESLIDVKIDHANISNCSVGVYIGYLDSLGDYSDTTVTNSNFFNNDTDFVLWALSPSASLTTSNNYYGGSAPVVELAAGFTIIGINSFSETPILTKQDTDVTADIDPVYTIVIPASVDFGTLVKDSGIVTLEFDVSAQGVIIEDGASVDVEVTGPFTMMDNNGTGSIPLAYTLSNEGGTITSPYPAIFANFTGDGTEDGSVSVDTSAITAAGSYKGTMTFTITYN